MNWGIAAGAVLLTGTAVVTLRAAEQATRNAAVQSAVRDVSMGATGVKAGAGMVSAAGAALESPNGARSPSNGASLGAAPATPDAALHAVPTGPAGNTKQHPPASAPEESATIADDPTTAPDPSQSADNNVSFPTDI